MVKRDWRVTWLNPLEVMWKNSLVNLVSLQFCYSNQVIIASIPGDYFTIWRTRWIVISDSCISWFKKPYDLIPRGTLLIDQGFRFTVQNRIIIVLTSTRKLVLQASTKRLAAQWTEQLTGFYLNSTRITPQPFGSSYPPRLKCEVKVLFFIL